jgi:hypothetical protein
MRDFSNSLVRSNFRAALDAGSAFRHMSGVIVAARVSAERYAVTPNKLSTSSVTHRG